MKLKTILMQNFGEQMRCILEDVQVAYEQKPDHQKNYNRDWPLRGMVEFKSGLRGVLPVTAIVTKVVLSILGAHLLHMAWLQGNNTPCDHIM